MGTSIGAAIDWLVDNITPAIAAEDSSAVVSDNEPTQQAQGYVAIGRTLPLDEQSTNGTQIPLVMGLQKREEEYSIPCFVQAARPGPAQKPSRDAAILLFDTCHHVVAQNPYLGGVLLDGRYAWVDNIRVVYAKTTQETGALRVTTIMFDVHCKNHYIP